MSDNQQSSQKAAAGGPTAMGMSMAKKMMSQMGSGGSPMEMMHAMHGIRRIKMTTFKSAISATMPALVIAPLIVSGPLAAQPMPQQGQGRPSTTEPGSSGQMQPLMPGGMMGMMGQDMMSMMMGEHVEGRIAFLRTELKITDAQLPQWNTFADALRANAKRMSEIRSTMMQGGMMGQGGTSLSAPDRLDRMEKMMTAMLDAVKATKSALEPLYAVLSDDQKKLADQLIRGPMGMGPT